MTSSEETTLQSITWHNPWLQLPDCFFSPVQATPLDHPYLLHRNSYAAEKLGFAHDQLFVDYLLDLFSGNLSPNPTTIATVYAGHQFGIFTSQLGDGRVVLLGEVEGVDQLRYEIQLKGAGLTPYSRTLDGRCPLASAIREYLGAEALAALDIPTSRPVCLLGSDTVIQRDKPTTSAILVRMARSHLRFGHFEYFHHRDEFAQVKQLVEFTIEQLFPHLLNEPLALRPLRLLELITERTASLVAAWQSVGFTHGVINTDNMTATGDTVDFGPFGFMENYNPAFAPNASDDLNRYQFDQQPEIGRWNCLALAEALSSLLPNRAIPAKLLRLYRQQYQQQYLQRMRLKLGLQTQQESDNALVTALLETLQHCQIDYSLFFWYLADFDAQQLCGMTQQPDRLANWLASYQDRLSLEHTTARQRQQAMNQVNPGFILRRAVLDKVLKAAEQGDFSEFNNVLQLLQNPFDV